MTKRKERFKRRGSDRRIRINKKWRKPKGPHSKIRREIKGAGKKPKPGYGREKDKRGLHPSGYEEALVHNLGELEDINEEEEAVRISSRVGLRKKVDIVKKATDLDLKVLNPSNPEDWLKGIKKKRKGDEEVKEEKETKKEKEEPEEEGFECPECGKTFDSERGMKIHKGKVH